MGRILVVDDEPGMRRILGVILADEGHEVCEASGAVAAEAMVRDQQFDLVVTDQRLPDGDGIRVMATARDVDPTLPVVFLTAYATVDLAVQAMRGGAFDVITKPFVPEHVVAVVARALERAELVRDNQRLRVAITRAEPGTPRPAQSQAMRIVADQVARVAPTSATVLITGETGVGKELAARAIHQASQRASEPFVAINCAAFPEQLLESELFGHERGAFTGAATARAGLFETAHRGTLFLDEAGEMSLGMQAKLLRVLAERTLLRVGSTRARQVDVRVIVATHRDLRQRVELGLFRDDLYYRLNVVPIHVPPLRERRDDMPGLVEGFLVDIARELKIRPKRIASAALGALCQYAFPGNVRELRNMIERACILVPGDELQASDLMVPGATAPAPVAAADEDLHERWLASLDARLGLRTLLEDVERTLIVRALDASEGRQAEAARALSISRSDLSYKLRKYGLQKAPPINA